MILPTRLFERFQFTEARALVSIQGSTASYSYLREDENADVATEAQTEFLHKMSHQALNGENDDVILLNFTELHLVIDELTGLFIEGVLASAIYNRQAWVW